MYICCLICLPAELNKTLVHTKFAKRDKIEIKEHEDMISMKIINTNIAPSNKNIMITACKLFCRCKLIIIDNIYHLNNQHSGLKFRL